MTNKERQKLLDKKKWSESAKQSADLSGKMDYCKRCDMCEATGCRATQALREGESLCAKAYNRMKREVGYDSAK